MSPNRPCITCREPYAIISGDAGRVLCVELIPPMALAASNHFRRIAGVWRMIHHQSSPIAQIAGQSPDDVPAPPRQVH